MRYTVTMPAQRSLQAIDSTGPDLGNLALEFLDTLRRAPDGGGDRLRTPQDLLDWLAKHAAPGQVDGAAPTVSEARILLEEGRRLREDIRGMVEDREKGRIPEWAVFGVNRVLAAGPRAWRLADSGGRPTLVETPIGTGPLRLLEPIARAAADLVTRVPADRLRRCASDRCGAWFVDTSKGGQRRWCSMALCGNREKAAAHRAKTASR
jgi:predicted RNA-binding Zn ribbon-like protein